MNVIVLKPIFVVGVRTAEPPSTVWTIILTSPTEPLANVRACAAPVVVREVNALTISTAPAPESDWVPRITSLPKEELTVTAPVLPLTVTL